ncbi:hypothetical protein HYC85_006123 [Camellia sinensis]|uniref:CSN8/PSMD8/EIF3K domain-containing protein n=1 Tax=Camellia sinensis TaxID=4442 RepID=A0A7J7I454_CAMSI|nr:hypothetical protein HYC85_006123 [Camellia sinensis]
MYKLYYYILRKLEYYLYQILSNYFHFQVLSCFTDDVSDFQFAGDICEHAVVLSVKIEDQGNVVDDVLINWVSKLSADLSYLSCLPLEFESGRLLPSPQEYPILGLNLLRLLVQNRIVEFHIELELLSASAMENNCIKHAVELEQSFIEGAYNRVLSVRQTLPHET